MRDFRGHNHTLAIPDQLISPLTAATGLGRHGMIFIPVIGGLIIGLMASYGSERIRGHGIPEAFEPSRSAKAECSPRSRS
jgi:H+/Cl- antiporter ClcA